MQPKKWNSYAKKLLSQLLYKLLIPFLLLSHMPSQPLLPVSCSFPAKCGYNTAPSVSAPAHPHQIHSPLCPFPISQTSCWEGQIMLDINIKVFELNHLEVRKKLEQ